MAFNRISGKKTSFLLATFFLLAGTSPVMAQLVADFTPSTLSGCSPLAVSFVNNSTGTSPSASYTWTFGNGNGITTNVKNNPVSATYFNGQDYTVTLAIQDGIKTASVSKIITVFKSPLLILQLQKRWAVLRCWSILPVLLLLATERSQDQSGISEMVIRKALLQGPFQIFINSQVCIQ